MARTIRFGLMAAISLAMANPILAQPRAELNGPTEPVRFTEETAPARMWASAEYLHWWVRSQPAPGPLVTTGDPAARDAGFLIDPSTRVLFGDDKIEYGPFSGARLTAGVWLDSDGATGIEFSGFVLNSRTTHFQASSDPTGVPILAMPFTTVNGGPGAFFLASNGNQLVATLHGVVDVTTSSRFLGADLNSVFNAWRLPGDNFEIVLGLRYLDLQERIETSVASSAVLFDGLIVGNDSFRTRNHYLGAQVGARWTGGSGRWSTSLGAFIGLGGTNQILSIDGSTTLSGTAATTPGTVPGLLYTQGSNIGRHQQVVFSAVPQVQAKIGYNILSNLRFTFGYDFICWTNVGRASDQIDHVVNTTQQSPDISPDGALRLTGDPRPAPRMRGSNFWAQGFVAGMEFSW